MTPPTKSDVVDKLQALINDALTREDVAGWAQQWVIEDNPQDMPKDVWDALTFLCAADMISTDRPYLYEREDFEEELAKLA
jgi:hypothetical protein